MRPHDSSVAMALAKLRRYVSVCGIIIGLALASHVFIWSMVTFTDVRFRVIDVPAEPETVVVASRRPAVAVPIGAEAAAAMKAPEEIRVRSKYDQLFRDLSGVTLAAGMITVPAMVLLVGLGVILIAATGRTGADRAISAWIWAMLVSALALPLGRMLDLPWRAGGLQPYDDLLDISTMNATVGGYLQTLVLYGTCVLGTVLTVARFRRSVNQSVPDDLGAVDPHLEREAANVQATTYSAGGRSAAALSRVVGGAGSPVPPAGPAIRPDGEHLPSATAVSPGDRPKRII